jgi:signal peptidase I
VSDTDDLRSRIEAQVAARRGKPKGRHARVRAGEPGHHQVPKIASPMAATQIIEAVPADRVATRYSGDTRARGTRSTRDTPEDRRRPGRSERGFRLVIRLTLLITVAGVLALALRTFVVEPFWIPSESMEQTLHGCTGCNDDRLLVDKLSYRLHPVHRGDVVVFKRPPSVNAAERVLIKRVIGLPGEKVSGRDGKVWIGNRVLDEPYVNGVCKGTQDFAAVTVPAGDVFVMGDNRCDSTDSRVFGPIRKSSIIGRAFLIIWPLGRIHWL